MKFLICSEQTAERFVPPLATLILGQRRQDLEQFTQFGLRASESRQLSNLDQFEQSNELDLRYELNQNLSKQDFVYITVSTGVGAGIVCNGNLITCQDGFCAHLGHTTVPVKNNNVY